MGFRFRRSLKIAPGVRLNLGLKSLGLSFGGKGFHISTNSRRGTRATVGLPGTGLSYSQKLDGATPRVPHADALAVGRFVGYVVDCNTCGTRLTLPPFDDPATVFRCSSCQATMQLAPALQAQLVSPANALPAAQVTVPGTRYKLPAAAYHEALQHLGGGQTARAVQVIQSARPDLKIEKVYEIVRKLAGA